MHQPSAYSFLSVRDIASAAAGSPLRAPGEAQTALRDLLMARFDATAVVGCGSGTQALELALRTAAYALRDERPLVALPAYSCFDVASAAIGAGVGLSFYDVDSESLSPELDSVRRVLAEGARVIVVTPLHGYPIAWDELREITTPAGAILIEDAAQGVGARYGESSLGSLGDLSVLSFGRGKGWTGGGGGALLTRGTATPLMGAADSGAPLRPSRSAAPFVGSLAQLVFGRPGLYGIPAGIPWLGLGETRYVPPRAIGTISTFSARLAVRTSNAAFKEIGVRRDTALRLLEKIDAAFGSDERLKTIREVSRGEPSYLRLPVLVQRSGPGRTLPGVALRAGVAHGYPDILPRLPAVQRYGFAGYTEYPGAVRLARELLTLPTHRFVGEKTQAALVRAIRSTLEASPS